MTPWIARALSLPLFSLVASQTWDSSIYASSPPVYPSPSTSGVGGWEQAFHYASSFVANLTADEKAGLVTGTLGPCVGNIAPIERLGFHGLCLQDGPLAIRQADYASVFPAGVSSAASWDRHLINLRGRYMGEEFKGKGAHLALGPVAGPLGRTPYDGRNWEGFSVDPYLTGVAMQETIRGMQSVGAQACAKHFIAYEQETQRMPSPSLFSSKTTIESVSSNLDDRTMHELYLWPFMDAVHAGVASVMCSYNRINSSYGCQNSKTLNGILKSELGFQGYVVSDWSGTHSGLASALAGLDMDMPGGISASSPTPSFFGGNLTTAVRNGSLPESRLTDMATRVMTPYFALSQNRRYPSVDPSESQLGSTPISQLVANALESLPSNRDVRDNHAALIRTLGSAGIVLLKNEDDILPLHRPKVISIFGNSAGDLVCGLNIADGDFELGTLPTGGGSGSARLSYVVPPLEAIKSRARQDGTLVQYYLDNDRIPGSFGLPGSIPGLTPDACIVFLKTWMQEAQDRTNLTSDWNGDIVVDSVASSCPSTIVITNSGGPNVMPWANNRNVKAILAAHYPGQETGNSIIDVLYGAVNPSGKLPYTIANQESDYNARVTNSMTLMTTTDPNAWQSDFTEGLMIDYRYFDSAPQKPVLYEFGYGLSYTTFSISEVRSSSVSGNGDVLALPAQASTQPGGNPHLWDHLYTVTCTARNTGKIAGATVAQLYLALGSNAPQGTPVQHLRGFEKIFLEAGQSRSLSFNLTRRDLSFWDINAQGWSIPSGQMEARVGFSSRDIRGRTGFSVRR